MAAWLADAATGRNPFDVTLLLMAALHRDVLAGAPEAMPLSRYYPTAGRWSPVSEGQLPADGGPPDLDLSAALRVAILDRQDMLAAFIRRATVQTNETGRGAVWLLPVTSIGWPAVHLVELGASAGLNLVAERRAYRLVDAVEPSRSILELGDGRPVEFVVRVKGEFPIPIPACCPIVLSRTGGDLSPFLLHSAQDELTLASFVWADQVERLARLREGIAALRSVESTAAPVRLRPLRLSGELPGFLARELPRPLDAPVVLFNTTVTLYLPDRGAAMREMIAEWAVGQSVPVLWLQWETAPDGEPQPPARGWLAWTADYWPNDGRGQSHHWRLAWVHPHGTALEWEPDWLEFLRITMQS